MTEALDRETQGDKQPDAAPQVASSRSPVIAVSLAGLGWVAAVTGTAGPGQQPQPQPQPERAARLLGASEAILEAIKSEPKTAGQIAKETGLNRGTISTTLTKLTKEGAAVKAERGYRAA